MLPCEFRLASPACTTTAKTTPPTMETAEIATPAMASPRPRARVRPILRRATMPRISPSGEQKKAQIKEAIASASTPGFGGGAHPAA